MGLLEFAGQSEERGLEIGAQLKKLPHLVFLLAQANGATPPVTFTRDVAPILYRHCVSCHRSGAVAPFPLMSYAEAAKRAKLIAQVTSSRYMPPWKPEPRYGDFEGARALTAREIRTL